MNHPQANSISRLPLSWARTSTSDPVFNTVKLPFSSPSWIPTAEIPHHYSFERVYDEHLSLLPSGFVLQSCSLSIRDYLIQQGCQVAAMGAEAVLDLPWQGKRSVRELARRGQRHGFAHEIASNPIHQHRLAQLIGETPSRQGVRLRHTERPGFDASTRCFVFEAAEGRWMGAITLSTVAPDTVHTEMLLRRHDAPIGVMEALITAIAQQLTQEGVSHLSLGNVTPLPAAEDERIFTAFRHPQELWMPGQLAFRLGRSLNFAYNAEGLWRFKNKFAPRWQPSYLCGAPRLSVATVAGLIQATGYFNLIQNRLLASWPISMPEWSKNFLLGHPQSNTGSACPGLRRFRTSHRQTFSLGSSRS